MKTTTSGTDKDSLYSYIERANSSRPRSKTEKTLWCIGIAFAVTMCLLFVPTDVNCLFAILAAFIVPLCFMFYEIASFTRTSDFSYGLGRLSYVAWDYMELCCREPEKGYFFQRMLRSPAFILVAGFYYKLKVGDEVVAAKLIALARERDSDLNAVEMSSNRGLRPRDVMMLAEKFRSDLGVTWIYKLRQKKVWATLLFMWVMLAMILYLIAGVGIVYHVFCKIK